MNYNFDWCNVSAPPVIFQEVIKSVFGSDTELQELTPTFFKLTGSAPRELTVIIHPPNKTLFLEIPGAVCAVDSLGFNLARKFLFESDKLQNGVARVTRCDVKHDFIAREPIDIFPQEFWFKPEKFFKSSAWESKIFGNHSITLSQGTCKVRLYSKHLQLISLGKRGKLTAQHRAWIAEHRLESVTRFEIELRGASQFCKYANSLLRRENLSEVEAANNIASNFLRHNSPKRFLNV